MASISGRIFRNITSSWLTLFVNIAISFFLAPFIVNSLGSELYGIWAVAMQFTGYIYLLDFGVRDALIRYTAKYRAKNNDLALRRILSIALLIYFPIFLLGLLASGIVAISIPYWTDIPQDQANNATLTVFLVGASVSSTFLFNIYSGLLLGLQRFDVTNIINIFTTILRAIAIVIVLGNGGHVVELAWIQLIFTILNGALIFVSALLLMRKANLSTRPAWVSGKRRRALLRLVSNYSVYVFINNIGQKLVFASDALVISIFLPIASVTYYAIAGNLISYLSNLVMSTAGVFNPVASQYATNNDQESLRKLLLRSTRLTLTISLPVITTYIILGDLFIGLWMGPEFAEEAGLILIALAAAQVLGCPHHSIASILYGIGQHRRLAFLRLFEGFSNLALSIILIQHLGTFGVALGTAIPHTILFGLFLPYYVCRLLGVPFSQYVKESLGGPLLSIVPFAIGAVLVYKYLPPSNLLLFFITIALLSLSYLASSYFLCLRSDEKVFLKNLIRKRFVQRDQ